MDGGVPTGTRALGREPRVPAPGLGKDPGRCPRRRRVPGAPPMRLGEGSPPHPLTSCSFRAVRVASRRCSFRLCAWLASAPGGMARAPLTRARCLSRSSWSSWRPARAACSLSLTRPRSQAPGRGDGDACRRPRSIFSRRRSSPGHGRQGGRRRWEGLRSGGKPGRAPSPFACASGNGAETAPGEGQRRRSRRRLDALPSTRGSPGPPSNRRSPSLPPRPPSGPAHARGRFSERSGEPDADRAALLQGRRAPRGPAQASAPRHAPRPSPAPLSHPHPAVGGAPRLATC